MTRKSDETRPQTLLASIPPVVTAVPNKPVRPWIGSGDRSGRGFFCWNGLGAQYRRTGSSKQAISWTKRREEQAGLIQVQVK